MSYAIGNIVYGIDASENSQLISIIEEWLTENSTSEIQTSDDFQENWCQSYYSAGGLILAVFGIQLGYIDECNNISIERLNEKAFVNDNNKLKYMEMYNKLPLSLRSKIEDAGLKAETFILWSSS